MQQLKIINPEDASMIPRDTTFLTLAKDVIRYSRNLITHEAAGGYVFFQTTEGKIYVALLKNSNDEYFLPKGHLQEGETPEDAAKREIIEELALQVPLIPLGKVGIAKYHFQLSNDKRSHYKIVHLFAFKINQFIPIKPDDNSYETALWIPIEQAYKLITHDVQYLKKAVHLSGYH